MAWSIRWTDQAVRDLSKFDRPVARRVVAKLEQAVGDPPRFFSRLVGADDYKRRIGDYRLFAALVHESRTVVVERVGHRRQAYRR